MQNFWLHQLPDDIIPDFKSSAEDQLTLVGLSLGDGAESSRFNASISDEIFGTQVKSSLGPSNAWDKKFMNRDQRLTREMEVERYNGDSSAGFANARLGDQVGLGPVEILAFQFPNFSADSLAEAYFANGCDLSLTIKMLGQLEGYGMTEAGPVLTMCLAFAKEPFEVKSGSCGTVVRNPELKNFDPETGISLSKNQSGEICIRGKQIMKGTLYTAYLDRHPKAEII